MNVPILFSFTPSVNRLVHLLPKTELLNGEIFYSLRKAQILIEQCRVHYHTIRPHSALGYHRPAPEIIVPIDQRPRVQ